MASYNVKPHNKTLNGVCYISHIVPFSREYTTRAGTRTLVDDLAPDLGGRAGWQQWARHPLNDQAFLACFGSRIQLAGFYSVRQKPDGRVRAVRACRRSLSARRGQGAFQCGLLRRHGEAGGGGRR
jgi:hypothetical protein